MMTFMSSCAQRLLDNIPAVRTVGAGVVGWNGNRRHTKHLTKVLQPVSESRPCRIRNGLGEFSIFDHVAHHQVLVGNQVIRLDNASCQFHGKIFTLPTYLEVFSSQVVSALGSVLRTLLGLREAAAKTFECLVRLPEMSRILNSLTIRVGIEVGQPHIQPDSLTRWLSFLNSLNIKTKLNVVSVSSTDNPNSLDLIQLIKVQVTGSEKLEASGFKTISESYSSSILRKFPSASFVLYRTVSLMLLKTRKTLLGSFLLTVVVEPSHRRPSPFSRSLTSHRVELVCPRKIFGKNGAISTQFIAPNFLVIHPVSDAAVSDKTRSTNGFIKPLILLFFSLKFGFKYQHFTSVSLT